MKENRRQIKTSMIYTIIAVIAVSIFCYFFWEEIKDVIKELLCSGIILVITTILILFLYALHFYLIKMKDEDFSSILSDSIPPALDHLFGALTYITVISTCHTIFKGLFLQLSYNEEYFKDFGSIDIASLAIFMAILLWYAVSNIIKDINEIFFEEDEVDVKVLGGQILIKNESEKTNSKT